MVHDGLLDAAHVDRFKVLIFPNIAALSDLRSAIRFARTCSAEAASSRRMRRHSTMNGAFAGKISVWPICSEHPSEEASMRGCKILICASRTVPRHPILAGLEDTERIINGVSRVHTKGSYPNPPLTLIPSYPDLPMEEVFPREPKTDIPEVYVREVGKGRVVYFPWDIDRTFWEVLSVDHLKLLAMPWIGRRMNPGRST